MTSQPTRRQAARWAAIVLAGTAMPVTQAAAADRNDSSPNRQRLALGWRLPEGSAAETDRVGVLEIDWPSRHVTILADHPAPGRAHGLHPMPDGGFVAVANRPGRWLMRFDTEGRLLQRHALADDATEHTLGGHALVSTDGERLFTCETDPVSGEGWIGLRDAHSLRRLGAFPSAGLDPHQMQWDAEGALWVANGGIVRHPDGRKTALHRMAPSLVRLDPRDGRVLAQHRLDDPRLSLRHLAWADETNPRLGVALQAEHDDEAQRQQAPVLAVLEDGRLWVPSHDSQAAGYAGDISPGPGGGFVISGQKVGRGLWWHPGAADRLTRMAELGEPCALASWDQGRGVLIAARLGLARWHVDEAPRMLRWPLAMSPDNHALLLG